MENRTKAVFLDRDGVINKLILNPVTQQYESPHKKEDFVPLPAAAEALRLLRGNEFLLIIVSNQPSWAKKKTTHENLVEINENLLQWCAKENIDLAQCYYCYHHPDAIVPELKVRCKCRKPGGLFIEQAVREFNIGLDKSWFVGDRITDIECGKQAGCRTILVESEEDVDPNDANADFSASGLLEAARIIIGKSA